MITEYDVVSVSDVATLKAKVSDALSKGWQPYESLQVSTSVVNGVGATLYTQVLVKVAEPPQAEEDFLVK